MKHISLHNYTTCAYLQAERMLSFIKSPRVPYTLRAAFLDLLVKIHMDIDPIHPTPLINHVRLVPTIINKEGRGGP